MTSNTDSWSEIAACEYSFCGQLELNCSSEQIMPLRSTLVIVHYYSWWNINWRIASYRIVLLAS